MYYIYVLIIYVFVLFISAFVLGMFSMSVKQSDEYIIYLVSGENDIKRIGKRIKEIYYEESLAGKNGARKIIIVDDIFREELSKMCDDTGFADYLLMGEIDEYLRKRTETDEQSTI
ncbi:hypothetical protein [Ruminococcus sp. NK3A76]|uniref:hypothetical protein n=1 Tax=Ruminococcus sp. NK3A76 TaxID=877411 RepID=UPI00049070AB|nr:hypothetical protein [Ruminococcus sp. NK3A76]